LWNKLVQWLETFDPVQMRYAGNEWRKLVDYVEQIARAMDSVRLMPSTCYTVTDHGSLVLR
jgi:COP9 signalosome complex subunit 3